MMRRIFVAISIIGLTLGGCWQADSTELVRQRDEALQYVREAKAENDRLKRLVEAQELAPASSERRAYANVVGNPPYKLVFSRDERSSKPFTKEECLGAAAEIATSVGGFRAYRKQLHAAGEAKAARSPVGAFLTKEDDAPAFDMECVGSDKK